MIRIVIDSTSDFSLEEAKKFNIEVVPLSIIFKDRDYLDRYELNPNEFYKLLETKDYPTTSQPSPQQFLKAYEKFNENDEILVITLSSELSGTFQSAKIASEDIKQKIEIIDSKTAAIATKLLVLKAIKLRDEGKSFDEIVNCIRNIIDKTVIYAGINTLEYLVKGGRLSKTAGIAGTLLKIKPLITVSNGKIEMLKKSRGLSALLQEMINRVLDDNIDKEEPIILGYTKDNTQILNVKKALEDKGYSIYQIIEIGSTVGVHAGPNACAISYLRK